MSFDVNKTAALCVFKGPRSIEAKKKHLLSDKPALYVQLKDGQQACVRLVESYLHLGGWVTHSGSCLLDVESRRRATQHIYARLQKTLFKNKALSGSDKRELLSSLVLRKFLFGSGNWVLRTQKEKRTFHAATMGLIRGSCRAITGYGSKLLRDEELCSLLQVLQPEEMLHCERVRSLLETVGHGPGFLWDLLVDERVWLEQAVDSLRRVLATLGRDWQLPVCYQACLTVLGCRIQQGSALLRASRKLIHDRGHEAQAAKALASEIQQLETDGCVVVARPCVTAQGRWRCKPCGQGFGSRAALRAHQAIRHGQRAVTAIVSGTQCLSCNQEYWSTARLERTSVGSADALCVTGTRTLTLPVSMSLLEKALTRPGGLSRGCWLPNPFGLHLTQLRQMTLCQRYVLMMLPMMQMKALLV